MGPDTGGDGTGTGRSRSPWKRWRGTVVAWAFILPAALPMAVLVGVPLAQTVFFSFTNLKEKNFDVRTLGLEPAPAVPGVDGGGTSGAAAGPGIAVKVEPGGPAARAGVPDGARIVAVGGDTVRNTAGFNRLSDRAKREFVNGRAKDLEIAWTAPGAVAGATSYTARLAFARAALDWRVDPERSDARWGIVGLKNYREILGADSSPAAADAGREFRRTLGTTVAWTVVNVSLHFILGLALALLLNRQVAGVRWYRAFLMLPWAVPVYVSAFSWRWLFNGQYGLFNRLLEAAGRSPIPWLSDATWTFVAATVTNVWLGVPFMMITLLAGLQSIPKELYEAADIDGCTRWQATINVTMPMLRPVSMTAVLLGTIWTFNMFNVIWLLQGGGRNVEILATRAFRLFYEGRDYAASAAYGVVILGLLVVFSALYARVLRAGDGARA